MLVAVLPMVPPSTGSTIAFCLLVIAVVLCLIWGVAHAGRVIDEPAEVRRCIAGKTLLGAAAWMVVTAFIPASGVLAAPMFPPPLMLFLVGSLAAAVILACSKIGTRLVTGVPIFALVGFQSFRLPLELVLHTWYEQGVIPVQMTYSGHNFDIVSGVLGLVVGGLLWRRGPIDDALTRRIVWAFNLIGSVLLATVATIAVLSAPLPLRMYMNDPPVLLGLHAPYAWIVPFCVGGALFGHILVFRWLLKKRR